MFRTSLISLTFHCGDGVPVRVLLGLRESDGFSLTQGDGRRSACRSEGQSRIHSPAAIKSPIPPTMTHGTVPISDARMPDSNAPSSLEVPTNSMLTVERRPRRASGVAGSGSAFQRLCLPWSPGRRLRAVRGASAMAAGKLEPEQPGEFHARARNKLGRGKSAVRPQQRCRRDQEQMAARNRNRPTPRTRDIWPGPLSLPPPTGQYRHRVYELPKVDNIAAVG